MMNSTGFQGPKYPWIIQLIQWLNHPFSYLEENCKKYGDVFILPFSMEYSPTVIVSDPILIKFIFTREYDLFYPYSKTLIDYGQKLIGEAGLSIAPDAKRHRHRRKELNSVFHSKVIKNYAAIIQETTEKCLNQQAKHVPFDVLSVAQSISRSIIYQGVLGLDAQANSKRLQDLFTAWTKLINTPVFMAMLLFPSLRWTLGRQSWASFCQLNRDITACLKHEISKRAQDSEQEFHDILALLIAGSEASADEQLESKIQSQCKELLIAGESTTSAAIAWLIYNVYRHPQVLAQIRAELDTLGPAPALLEIAQLPYLTATCQESLRLNAVNLITLTRIVQQPITLAGYAFTPGMKVTACPYLVHRRPDIYQQPNQFKPERFLEKTFSPYEYLPFGGGSRRCIGGELALLEMKLTLATFIQTPGLELALEQPVRPYRRAAGDVKPAHLTMKLTV